MINIYVGAVFFAIDTKYSYQISPSYIQIHRTKETRERERETQKISSFLQWESYSKKLLVDCSYE